jgi:RNA polymerase sigma-70 factor (ECF subfamily)
MRNVANETSALATVELRHSRQVLHRRLSDEQQHWLADLYRANASAVYFVCQFLLRRPEDAADATQEVFLKAVESLRGRSTTEHARSWLLTAAQNHCLEVLRRDPQMDKPTLDPIADSLGGTDPESAVVERALIKAVLGELRVRERRALLLWAVERRPLAEIARDLGLSYTAVQQLLFRARRHAASVAARVAALLGVFHLGRVVHRASQAGQLALVAVVVPVVLAVTPSSAPALPSPASGGGELSPSVSFGRAPVGAAKSLTGSATTADATIAALGRSLTVDSTVSLPIPPTVTLPAKAKKILDADLAGETLDQALKQSFHYP